MTYSSSGYQAPPAPRAVVWPWIVAVVAALGIGILVGVVISPAPLYTVTPAGPLVGGTAEAAHPAPFTLEASSSSGREMNINYANGSGGQDNAPSGTESSWSIVIPNGTEYGSGSLSVSTNAPYEDFVNGGDPSSDTVTCRITDGAGVVVDQQSGSGQSASANCFGY